jgi:hypothetical protein
MFVFQVSSRSVQSPGSPKKRPTRMRKWSYNILRLVCGGLIIVAIANLLFIFGLSILFFLLLPVCLSLVWTPSQLSKLIHGTLLYDVLTIVLAIIYYSAITGIELLIHTPGFGLLFRYHGPPVSLIIVVTTTLAWAIILAPLHSFAQTLIEHRFNRRDYEAARAIEAFTSTLHEEIDLAQVRDGLLVVVQQTMQPQTISVWVCKAVQHDMGSPSAYAEIPSKMFVTCFYAILDPTSGLMRYANAGHDLPYRHHMGGVSELRATGMPLGLMPGSLYEEYEVTIASGESLLFYTDGLVEAHNPAREMFGFPRLKTLLKEHSDGTSLFNLLLSELKSFTGEAWEQEDDITMVTLQRTIL